MVVHPSLGLPIDEVQTHIVVASKVATYSGSIPLQEFINRACNTVFPLFPIRGREARFLGHVLIVRVEHQELRMDQRKHSRCILCMKIPTLVPYWWSIIFIQRHCTAGALQGEGYHMLQLAVGCRLATHQYFNTTSTWWDCAWSRPRVGLERGDELVRSRWSSIHYRSYNTMGVVEPWCSLLAAWGSQRICWWHVLPEIDLGSLHRGVHSWWVDTGSGHHPIVRMGSWNWVLVTSDHQIGPHIWIAWGQEILGWEECHVPIFILLHSVARVDFQGRRWPGQWSRLMSSGVPMEVCGVLMGFDDIRLAYSTICTVFLSFRHIPTTFRNQHYYKA